MMLPKADEWHRKCTVKITMKLRPLFTLLLFVVSIGILVWIYYAATRKPKTMQPNPWQEVVADLEACSQYKFIKANQYDHFALIADGEMSAASAQLFRAMAYAARIQENNCADAIVRLGGHYTPPKKIVVFHGTTADNIDRSIAYEQYNRQMGSDKAIRRALNRGNRYAARALVWAAAGDRVHRQLLELHRRGVNSGTIYAGGYLVCPTCGNIYTTIDHDPFCPFCLTDGQNFITPNPE